MNSGFLRILLSMLLPFASAFSPCVDSTYRHTPCPGPARKEFCFSANVLARRSGRGSLSTAGTHPLAMRWMKNGVKDDYNERPILKRFAFNFWYALTAPFPDLRRLLVRTGASHDSKSGLSMSLRLSDSLLWIAAYILVGVLAYHKVFERWPIIDAVYFTCVCFSTVGYGDIVPSNPASKLFTCAFGLAGIALLGTAIAAVGSKLAEVEQETFQAAKQQSRKKILRFYDKMPTLVKQFHGAGKKDDVVHTSLAKSENVQEIRSLSLKPIRKLIWMGAKSLSVIVGAGLLIGCKLEGWSVLDSIYYSLITATTIGLGDLCPSRRLSRLLAIFFIPLSVASAGEVLASVGLEIVERRQKKVFANQLDLGLTREHLARMDTSGDGKVDREEYIVFMMLEMGLVNQEEIDELCEQFRRLDVSGSGYIDQDDLELMARLRQQETAG